MIAKRVRRTAATSDFARLGRYILAAKTETAAQLWTRTADYILDAKGGGEKMAWSRITNCHSEEPGWAIREILATQERNKRSKGDKSYHLIVSFPEGEEPTRAQLEDIEDTLCAGIGFAEHQRISAAHSNTQHFHLHIAINRVHPRSFRCIEPFYDYRSCSGCAGGWSRSTDCSSTRWTARPWPAGRVILRRTRARRHSCGG
ncbi:relaxase/mobilization nuclease domain-containing protein [Azospirillum sp. B506]|uniref:relaxase/mobilization nuclease domain-containing protein n=1 Tax=Azospirillum sp. B506 TaxID=137721 RepID=UPI000344AE81|nr:relaxase/mobilization nuclease domain-containing protein [Azospirillum sp. B506]